VRYTSRINGTRCRLESGFGRGVRLLRLTYRAADGPAPPSLTQMRHSVEGKDLPYCEVLPAPGIYRSQKARASCSRSGLSMYSSGVRFCRSKRLNPTSTGCPRLTREPTRRLISRSLRRLRGSWLGGDGPELSQLMGNHVQLRYHYT